jgi:uncharacterized protein YbjT (DUF2867 family)
VRGLNTFLRPNLYFQGFFAFQASIAQAGRFFAPIGDARVSAVDVRDIAAVAALALTQPGHIGKTYTITGPAAVTHAEIAAAIGAAIGREVKFIDVPPEDFANALRAFGIPAWQVDGPKTTRITRAGKRQRCRQQSATSRAASRGT